MTRAAALAWRQPPLSGLTLEETYVYYDGPKVFTCINDAGIRFLCEWAEESAGFDQWLCTALSKARYRQLRDGQTPLREFFQHPEGPLYILTERWEATGARYDIRQCEPHDVPEAWLPTPEATIKVRCD